MLIPLVLMLLAGGQMVQVQEPHPLLQVPHCLLPYAFSAIGHVLTEWLCLLCPASGTCAGCPCHWESHNFWLVLLLLLHLLHLLQRLVQVQAFWLMVMGFHHTMRHHLLVLVLLLLLVQV